MNRFFIPIALSLMAAWAVSCSQPSDSPQGTAPEWYRGSSAVADDGTVIPDSLDKGKIDLLYFVSTEVLSARDEAGAVSYQSLLVADDRTSIDGEMAYVQKHLCQGDFNYLAPYYHQFTFEAIQLPDSAFQAVYDNVRDEVSGIISYYLDHINNGRPYALVGFSQGAKLVADVVKRCSKRQLGNMVGAYLLGYGLDAHDVENPNIIPATGERGFGHTISFNSVMSREGTWDVVYNNAVTAINPVNWRTDDRPGTFLFKSDSITVSLDTCIHELMVKVPDPQPYHEFMRTNPAYSMSGVSIDCLHRWDLLFYTQQIHDNILKRSK